MNLLKRLFKKSAIFLPIAAFILPTTLNAAALEPTDEQLKTFYSPFEKVYTAPLISQYPNIRFFAGLDAVLKKLSDEIFPGVVAKLQPPKNSKKSRKKYLKRLTYYKRFLALYGKINRLCDNALKKTTTVSPDTSLLKKFYEEISELLSTKDCDAFLAAAQEFIERWEEHIITESSDPTDSLPIDSHSEIFSKAQKEAQDNLKLFLANV